MNLKKEITNLKGKTFCMSFYGNAEIEAAKEIHGKDAAITQDMLPRETVANVLINCLTQYKPAESERKDVFEVMRLANWINDESADKPDLDDKLKTLLVKKVLPYSTITEKKPEDGKPAAKSTGIYQYWVIAQIYQELGVTE